MRPDQIQSGVLQISMLLEGKGQVPHLAHALTNLSRYAGNSKERYSVAQHSMHVCDILSKIASGFKDDMHEVILAGALHDGHKMVTGEIIHSVKSYLDQDWLISDLEFFVNNCIAESFDFDVNIFKKHKDIIAEADRIALMTERRDLIFTNDMDWEIEEGPDSKIIMVQPDDVVRIKFENLINTSLHTYKVVTKAKENEQRQHAEAAKQTEKPSQKTA